MIAKIYSAIPSGFNGQIIEVESDLSRGLPSFNIVGMANKTISEAKERVKSALINSNFSFPTKRLTINLAPAETHKDGTHLDLALALAILISSKQLHKEDIKNSLFVGELSLDGQLRPVRGIINIVEAAKSAQFKTVYLPSENLPQASLIKDINLIGIKNLLELFLILKKQRSPSPIIHHPVPSPDQKGPILDHILGQSLAKRALIIAVAGHHNILLSGPPGAGKTLLAKTALNLLPSLSSHEIIAVTKLHSLATGSEEVIVSRPFRNPHHTSSITSIIGGGSHIKPGEISLAHHGALFLDELPEYPRHILESLRQPLEDKSISISRAHAKTTYPANFMLIATMNPCPCGFLGQENCTCTPHQISSYQKKLSGPLLDRIDLIIPVQKLANHELLSPSSDHKSEHLAATKLIQQAIHRQNLRYHHSAYNSDLSSHQVSQQLNLTPAANNLLSTASSKFNLSARSYFKIIKVAQTIADLEPTDRSIDLTSNSQTIPQSLIDAHHIAEALTYRPQITPSLS